MDFISTRYRDKGGIRLCGRVAYGPCAPAASETLSRSEGCTPPSPPVDIMGKVERPSLESLIMDFAMSLTRRATCKRAQFSCVITSEDMTQIYGFGYNGTAKGFSHDDCKFDQPGNCQCVHAEQNALIKVRVNDPRKVVFVTGQPCVTCAKLIINSGASKVYYRSAYRSDEGLELFKRAGIEVERV